MKPLMSRKRRRQVESPGPGAFGPADAMGIPAFGGEGPSDLSDREPGDPDDEDEEDPAPRVIVATVGDLGAWIPDLYRLPNASRPVWFLREQDAPLVGVFERLPESSMAKEASDAILAGLRSFSLDQNENMQWLLGVTGGMQYGFHVDASLEDIVESFEDDGFIVIPAVNEGKILLGED